MSGHIVFLTLFLGLASGFQHVEVQVDPAVKMVRMLLDGQNVARITQPPWRATIDFGRTIEPQRLEAVGFNEKGDEVGRASQIINLPRPAAEIDLVLHDNNTAEMTWRHIARALPKRESMKLDGVALTVDQHRAKFPPLDLTHPHVLTADITFDDGINARREIVFGGAMVDSAETELTPLPLIQTSAKAAEKLEGCIGAAGAPLRVSAVEKPNALVVVVRDPNPREALLVLDPTRRGLKGVPLESDTYVRMLWPVPDRQADPGQPVAVLFPATKDSDTLKYGMLALVAGSEDQRQPKQTRQYADAVAVAGVQAATGGRRRAVVLILGAGERDASQYAPATVRRYLESIGVPLFVWSLCPSEGLAHEWGSIEDVSNQDRLRAAIKRLATALAAQRIAWVDADPIAALRAGVKESCGYAPVVRRR
jgi:hypothetical protein